MGARFAILVLGLMGGLLLAPPFVFAHKLHMFVTLEPGPVIAGRVYYSGSSPYRQALVEVLDRTGKIVKSTRSDEDGRFRLSLTPFGLQALEGFMVRCKSKDGHGVERKISVKGANKIQNNHTHDTDESFSHEFLRNALALEIRPLKEQIDALETKIWMRDILGGLGLLMGVFGLWMFWLARSGQAGGKQE